MLDPINPVDPCHSGEVIPFPPISSFHLFSIFSSFKYGPDFISCPSVSSEGRDEGGKVYGSDFKCCVVKFGGGDGKDGIAEFTIPWVLKLFIVSG